jgi:hypothetical protein
MTSRKIIGFAAFAAIAAGCLVAEFLIPKDHGPETWWSRIPAFFMIFGFFGALGLALFAKGLGRTIVQKDEDYYDR